ncbi:hypothetical protein GCM10023170_099240 [Phytohabitans houttuyneae]|uniref:Uncharacterized protein n=1 Tax=Phytohabitans houttuyneae TaxID=1076126 RepID=A0A6V8K668_9ACTN|nr:hypothetical protein Phou_014270 [Phytohabitans houttuyneae]
MPGKSVRPRGRTERVNRKGPLWIELAQQGGQLDPAADHGEPAAQVGPNRKARQVPRHMLAEVGACVPLAVHRLGQQLDVAVHGAGDLADGTGALVHWRGGRRDPAEVATGHPGSVDSGRPLVVLGSACTQLVSTTVG